MQNMSQSQAKSQPMNSALYARVKAEADAIFLSKTSAYKSGWIVKTYKDRGGTYSTVSPRRPRNGLTRWFKEKWVDLNRKNADGTYAECGRGKATLKGTYPLCRPSIHVNSGSPKTPSEILPEAIAQAKKEKQKVKAKGRIVYKKN